MKKYLTETPILKGVISLVSGSGMAQIVGILLSPILTRLYSPNDFGMLAAFSSVVTILVSVSSFKYEQAIPLVKTRNMANHLVILALFILFLYVLILCLILTFFKEEISSINHDGLDNFYWFIPFSVLNIGIFQILYYWCLREKFFTYIAVSSFYQTLIIQLSQLGLYSFSVTGLILGNIMGSLVGTTRLLAIFLPKAKNIRYTFRYVKILLKKFKNFPKYTSLNSLFNTVGNNFIPLVISGLFGPASAGLYILADKILSIPVRLICSSISNVFFAIAPELYKQGKLGELVQKTFLNLFKIAALPFAIFAFIGPELFSFIFGSEWSKAGYFAQLLLPWLFLVLLASPFSMVLIILGKQKFQLWFEIILFLSKLVGLLVGYYVFSDLLISIGIISIMSAICWLFLLIVISKNIFFNWKDMFLGVRKECFKVICYIFPLCILSIFDFYFSLGCVIYLKLLISSFLIFLYFIFELKDLLNRGGDVRN